MNHFHKHEHHYNIYHKYFRKKLMCNNFLQQKSFHDFK